MSPEERATALAAVDVLASDDYTPLPGEREALAKIVRAALQRNAPLNPPERCPILRCFRPIGHKGWHMATEIPNPGPRGNPGPQGRPAVRVDYGDGYDVPSQQG